MLNFKRVLLSFLLIILVLNVAIAQEPEIIFAISPMASPVSTLSSYDDFINYLSQKTGLKVILKQRRKYSDINSLLKSGEAQFAYTCTGAYLSGRSEFGLEVFAVPVIDGKTTYNSYIIVNDKSRINDLFQLRGKVFAFTDPLSLSGRLYPAYLLDTMGTKPEDFFKKTFYTSSHEKSIESVAYGFADGAAVDSLIFEDMKRKKVPVIDMVKIIKVSPPYGMPPLVVSPAADKSMKQVMLTALLKMNDDPSGKEILDKLQIDKFVLPDPVIYYNAVKLRRAVLRK